jgi:hypothetical protein
MDRFGKTLCGAAALAALLTGAFASFAAEEQAAQAENLVDNGGFEIWEPAKIPDYYKTVPQLPDGIPQAWPLVVAWDGKPNPSEFPKQSDGVAIRCDKTVKRSGESSARIECKNPAFALVQLGQCVDVDPGASYRVKLWIKGEGIGEGGGIGVSAICSTNDAKDDLNTWTGAIKDADIHRAPTPRNGTFDWKKFAFVVNTPKNAVAVRLLIALDKAAGTVWIDDVEFKKIDANATAEKQ